MLLHPSKSKRVSRSHGFRVAIVAARYNSILMEALLASTEKTLRQLGVTSRGVRAIRVPGSYEIPMIVARLARSHRYDAIIALGIVLRGKTAHAEHIGTACAIHLQAIAVETGVPVVYQILTPRHRRDARERIKIRGIEAAHTAVEMAKIVSQSK